MRISIVACGKYRAAFSGISIASKEQISSAFGAYIYRYFTKDTKKCQFIRVFLRFYSFYSLKFAL